MIKEFIKRWEEKKESLAAWLRDNHPEDYEALVIKVVETILSDEASREGSPDPGRVHAINPEDYQGTLVFVIGESGNFPHEYWYVRVCYGSCSGCDTLEGIKKYGKGKPSEQQVKDYMTLALHIVQGLRRMGGEAV